MIEQIPVIYKISAAIGGNTVLSMVPDIGGIENINNLGIAGVSIGILWVVWKQYEKERLAYRADMKVERDRFAKELKIERKISHDYHSDSVRISEEYGKLTRQIQILLDELQKKFTK